MCLDLCCCCHHLHTAGSSLLRDIHRHHTAGRHIPRIGKCLLLNSKGMHVKEVIMLLCTLALTTEWVMNAMNIFLCTGSLCVPFVLMNPNTLDISQTLMNNTLNPSWMSQPELKRGWIIADKCIYFVSKQFPGYQTKQSWEVLSKRRKYHWTVYYLLILTNQPVQAEHRVCLLLSGDVRKLTFPIGKILFFQYWCVHVLSVKMKHWKNTKMFSLLLLYFTFYLTN